MDQDSNTSPSSALWSCSMAMYLLHLRPKPNTVKWRCCDASVTAAVTLTWDYHDAAVTLTWHYRDATVTQAWRFRYAAVTPLPSIHSQNSADNTNLLVNPFRTYFIILEKTEKIKTVDWVIFAFIIYLSDTILQSFFAVIYANISLKPTLRLRLGLCGHSLSHRKERIN